MEKNALLRRIERLERQNLGLRTVALIFLLAIGGFFTMGQVQADNQDKVVEAQKFILRDEAGRLRAGLGIDPDNGTLHLALADKGGRSRANLSLTEAGRVGVFLMDQTGTVRAGLALRSDGTPDLGLADGKGTLRIGVGFDEKTRSPAVVLYDSEGAPRWRTP